VPAKKDDVAQWCIIYTDLDQFNQETEKVAKATAGALKMTCNALCNSVLRQSFDSAHQITSETE
jgi:hypothetical protein